MGGGSPVQTVVDKHIYIRHIFSVLNYRNSSLILVLAQKLDPQPKKESRITHEITMCSYLLQFLPSWIFVYRMSKHRYFWRLNPRKHFCLFVPEKRFQDIADNFGEYGYQNMFYFRDKQFKMRVQIKNEIKRKEEIFWWLALHFSETAFYCCPVWVPMLNVTLILNSEILKISWKSLRKMSQYFIKNCMPKHPLWIIKWLATVPPPNDNDDERKSTFGSDDICHLSHRKPSDRPSQEFITRYIGFVGLKLFISSKSFSDRNKSFWQILCLVLGRGFTFTSQHFRPPINQLKSINEAHETTVIEQTQTNVYYRNMLLYHCLHICLCVMIWFSWITNIRIVHWKRFKHQVQRSEWLFKRPFLLKRIIYLH